MATSKQRLKVAGTGHIAEEQFVPGEPGVIEPPDPPPAEKPKKSTQEGADKAPSAVKEEAG